VVKKVGGYFPLLKSYPYPKPRTDLLEEAVEIQLGRDGDVFACFPVYSQSHCIGLEHITALLGQGTDFKTYPIRFVFLVGKVSSIPQVGEIVDNRRIFGIKGEHQVV
jgi:hypothetical protein